MSIAGVVRLSGTLASVTQSASAIVFGPYNFQIWGTPLTGTGLSGAFSGTISLERSQDGGTTWAIVATDGTGTLATYTSAVSVTGLEPVAGVLYRVDCTAYASGTINYLLNQVGDFNIPLVRHA